MTSLLFHQFLTSLVLSLRKNAIVHLLLQFSSTQPEQYMEFFLHLQLYHWRLVFSCLLYFFHARHAYHFLLEMLCFLLINYWVIDDPEATHHVCHNDIFYHSQLLLTPLLLYQLVTQWAFLAQVQSFLVINYTGKCFFFIN